MFTLNAPAEVEGVVDTIIIGAGPAGMTAAVYLSRKKRSIAIVTNDLGGQMSWTLGIENYMGYQYITGRELTSKFEEQVRQFPVPIITDEAVDISQENNLFTVRTAGERTLQSRTVIVASGKRPKELGIPNEMKYVGRGLSYCATCDGPLFSKLDVAIAGGGNSALQAAIEMGQVAGKVYLISRSPWRADAVVVDKAEKTANLEKRTGFDILEVLGKDKVEGLRIRDKATGRDEVLKVQGVFVEIGLAPNTGFLKGILQLNQYGEIIVDQNCRTKVPGLFAAGDVTMVHEKQIVVAAGEGAKAALSAHEYLLKS
jgi:alkyl hydroperoxide reductase subunit F